MTYPRHRPVLLLLCAALTAGCSGDDPSKGEPQRAPRPVSVLTLRTMDPAQSLMITGTVGSWKTEEIGFEVTGRIEVVVEPETNVGKPGPDGKLLPLARIDSEKYATAVASANASIARLERQKEAAQIQLDQVLPAQKQAEVASRILAQSNYDRAKTLFDKDSITKAEFDQNVAALTSAQARVAQVDATMVAQAAEVTSIEAQIDQAKADLRDAQRDLDDCVLYPPFRGQVADVHAIPGGLVQRGEPVVTLQMMNPVKIEFEVSAERVRQLNYKDVLTVLLTRPDGSQDREEAIVFNTDASADPETHTFTITALIRNQLVETDTPKGVDADKLPKTRDIWAFIRNIIDETDQDYVEKQAIHRDSQGEYVWKIIEGENGERRRGPLLKVKKVRVTSEETLSDFLGLWKFRPVNVVDGEDFDPVNDRVLGELVLPKGATELKGDTVLFQREQWQLRPGDLVGVVLSDGSMPDGFYIPIDAIQEKSGRQYVFVVESSGESTTVRQIEVNVADGPNTLKRITATDGSALETGARIVLGGVHYLTDGEAVNVVSEREAN